MKPYRLVLSGAALLGVASFNCGLEPNAAVQVDVKIEGAGSVNSAPAGIFCLKEDSKGAATGVCSLSFPKEKLPMTLTGVGASGWRFDKWTLTQRKLTNSEAANKKALVSRADEAHTETWTATFVELPVEEQPPEMDAGEPDGGQMGDAGEPDGGAGGAGGGSGGSGGSGGGSGGSGGGSGGSGGGSGGSGGGSGGSDGGTGGSDGGTGGGSGGSGGGSGGDAGKADGG